MKGAFKLLLGKRITGVYVQENESSPRGQIFLVFDDATYFEFYSGGSDGVIRGTQGLDKGDIRHVRNLPSPENSIVRFDKSIESNEID